MIFHDHCYLDEAIEKKVMLVNSQPIGFYVLLRNKKFDVANLYACITLRQHYKYLADYLFIKLFDSEKVKYLNIGGSEDQGIHNFKSKYKPIKENSMHWVTNYSL
jgi:hypothetical protein